LHPKHIHIFGTQFLSFCDQYGWKNFQTNFDDFFGPEHHRCGQSLKSGPDNSVLTVAIYPHYLGRISCHFSFVRVKPVSIKFLRLFRAQVPPEHEMLETRPWWLRLVPKTYTHFLGCNSYRFASVRQKNVSIKFWRLFCARAPPQQAELKIRTGWLCFDRRNIPTLFGTRFLSFLIRTGKDDLEQIFTIFSGPIFWFVQGLDDSVEIYLLDIYLSLRDLSIS